MIAELFSLQGKVALVTGSSLGLGRAMAQALAGAGAHVVLNARNPQRLAKVSAAMREDGLDVTPAPFDVSNEEAVTKGMAAIIGEHGQLDILVNNAGTANEFRVGDSSTEEWQRVMDTDLTACFWLAREAIKPMVANGYGRIINIASIMSFQARPAYAAYVTAKHALVGLTRSLAVEYGGAGVTSNAIASGYFATEMMIDLGLLNNPDVDSRVRERTPVGRWGEPEELGGVAVFLASKAASYVNGAVLTVDGGMTAALFPDYPGQSAP
ncbi:MAG: SDR family oxidoreductase [Proteobacteria bacterium]|nr:SDR family oxidoreductase [Pseudomonadota bacterium]